jgi:Co/Zn/Cd efflux system component
MNMRASFAHLATDAAGSLGAIVVIHAVFSWTSSRRTSRSVLRSMLA